LERDELPRARRRPPDGALAAAFSLDPTGTPVRIITRAAVCRVPRDAFGEGLLAHAGVPGLFGGPVHDGLVRLPLRVATPAPARSTAPTRSTAAAAIRGARRPARACC
jgi:hypothetical protein